MTVFDLAIENGDTDMFNTLQASINEPGYDGFTPLLSAVDKENRKMIEALVEVGTETVRRLEESEWFD
ncbi:hypothetical protein RBB50_002345 [Rhinocladiella similis]